MIERAAAAGAAALLSATDKLTSPGTLRRPKDDAVARVQGAGEWTKKGERETEGISL